MSLLTLLELPKNRLEGGIPVELGMLTQLNTLLLDTKNLTRLVTAALSNCTHLLKLGLNSTGVWKAIKFGRA